MTDRATYRPRFKQRLIVGSILALVIVVTTILLLKPHPPKHSPCETGDALEKGPDPRCIDRICDKAPSCCANGGKWEQACVDLVVSYCIQQCDCTKTNVVAHEGPFNRFACDCTVNRVCPKNDSPCCDKGWEQTCIDQVASYYTNGCSRWQP